MRVISFKIFNLNFGLNPTERRTLLNLKTLLTIGITAAIFDNLLFIPFLNLVSELINYNLLTLPPLVKSFILAILATLISAFVVPDRFGGIK